VFAGLFVVGGAALLTLSFLLVRGQLTTRIPLESSQPPAPSQTSQRVLIEPGQDPAMDAFAERLREQALIELARQSAVALAVMTVIALAAAWWIAGRILRPLRNITATVRSVTGRNLEARIRMQRPDGDLKDLADTFDVMLERIERAAVTERRLIANASHELRTPLANQRAIIEVTLEDLRADASSLRGTLELVLTQNRRSQALIDALLLLAGTRAGQLTTTDVDLAETARAVLQEEAPGIAVASCLQRTMVRADPVLVERLIANLVHNAVRHNVPGGWMRVLIADRAIRIVNSGGQVDPRHIPSLFEPFVRQASRVRSDTGVGLGLPLVKEIADAHGAMIDAAPGLEGGLDVTVTFPAESTEDPAGTGYQPARSSSADSARRTRPASDVSTDAGALK
jgi:signal transduction histidine kinase